MENWIPFAEGEYLVDRTLLMTADHQAVRVEDVIVAVLVAGPRDHHRRPENHTQDARTHATIVRGRIRPGQLREPPVTHCTRTHPWVRRSVDRRRAA